MPVDRSLEVVGESHYQSGIRAMAATGGAMIALLVAEVDNPYDERAVRVVISNGARAEKVGYLNREDAAELWQSFADLGAYGRVAAGAPRFLGGTEDRPTFGLRVEVASPLAFARPLDVDITYSERNSAVSGTLAPAIAPGAIAGTHPPGWYFDSSVQHNRWWDGSAWGVVAPKSMKDNSTAVLLGVLLGGFSAHNFYLGRVGPAIGFIFLYWGGWALTAAYVGWVALVAALVWWIVDLVNIPTYVAQANAAG
jgi:TM2 domain-containing membrane protein YozV